MTEALFDDELRETGSGSTDPLAFASLPFAPLAERMRPRVIADVIGQPKLLGDRGAIRRMVSSGRLHSMILWGPPGSGKTTIARLLAESVGAPLLALSAVHSSVKEVRAMIERAQEQNRRCKSRTVLFIDEIHRFTKSQQDALLNAVEEGVVTLIGATTENPSFEVISPLLSRSRVFILESLAEEELRELLHRAIKRDEELEGLSLTSEAERALLGLSGGDARTMLNALELAAQLASVREGGPRAIDIEDVEQGYGRRASRYDKAGEEHYNIISAFIKSMRGSDPDASLYWLARMIEAGEDPEFIARRMLIFASEDVGNADPNALLLAVSCWDAVRAVGYPEARIIFGQVAVYLASAQKSNASYKAIGEALSDAGKTLNDPVPLHLRNAPTKLMKSLGYGSGYRYAHAEENAFAVGESYLPEALRGKVYYHPSERGREKQIKERLAGLWPERHAVPPNPPPAPPNSASAAAASIEKPPTTNA